MKKTSTLLFVSLAVATSLLLMNCKDNNKDKKAYDNASLSADSLCLVQPSWFPHAQTPAPAEGIGSPFDTSSTTNQIFHQWSWNKFLWLTKPVGNNTPLFLDHKQVFQVTAQMQMVNVPDTVSLVLQDKHQAGSASAMLVSNPSYNSGKLDTVYYSIHMNPTMYRFGDSVANSQTPVGNTLTFPVGSFEMKVSWIPVSAIPAAKQSQYYITNALLSRDSGQTFQKTQVAMLGMHVVGVVQNHPEFIWATFEHNDLAPNYDWKANAASSTTDKLLFKAGSTTGINGILYNSSTKSGIVPNQVFDLFQFGVPMKAGGGFMDSTSQSEPVNFNNVKGINQCVQQQLKDVWANYFYNGSIWLNMDGTTPAQQANIIDSLGYAIYDGSAGSYARGSLNCANVTMETFTQTFDTSINQINVNSLANCFSCHHSPSFFQKGTKSPLNMSHVYQDYLATKKGNTVQQAEKLKGEEEKQLRVFLKSARPVKK